MPNHKIQCLSIQVDISNSPSEQILISMPCCSCRVMKAVDVATCRVKKWQPEAHAAAINALLPVADNLVASGDDEGCIRLWDPRQASEASACFTEHTDFIADFAYQVLSSPSQYRNNLYKAKSRSVPYPTTPCQFTLHNVQEKDNCLVAASGDGTISITDLRKMKVGRTLSMPSDSCMPTSGALLCRRAPSRTHHCM